MERIDSMRLKDLRREEPGLLVVDVLDEGAFRDGHIPGAVNVPMGGEDFPARVEPVAGGRERPIVVYCADEACDASERAAEALEAAGFSRIYDFAAGLAEWREAHQPLVTADEPAGHGK